MEFRSFITARKIMKTYKTTYFRYTQIFMNILIRACFRGLSEVNQKYFSIPYNTGWAYQKLVI